MCFFISCHCKIDGFKNDYNIHTKTPVPDIKRISKDSFLHPDIHIAIVAPQSINLCEARNAGFYHASHAISADFWFVVIIYQ